MSPREPVYELYYHAVLVSMVTTSLVAYEAPKKVDLLKAYMPPGVSVVSTLSLDSATDWLSLVAEILKWRVVDESIAPFEQVVYS